MPAASGQQYACLNDLRTMRKSSKAVQEHWTCIFGKSIHTMSVFVRSNNVRVMQLT